MSWGVPLSLWDRLFAEGHEMAMRFLWTMPCASHPRCILLWTCSPAHCTSSWFRAPLPSSFVQGEPQSPLLECLSAQCWSLNENLSCSTQHNIPIIAPLQGSDTCPLVYPGPRKADRDLSGRCCERVFHRWMWTPPFVAASVSVPECRAPTCTQAAGLRCNSKQSPVCWSCVKEKELLLLCPNAAWSRPFRSFLKERAPLAP